jgi:hypothetical protein
MLFAACDAEPRQPSPTETREVTTTTVPATTTTTLSIDAATAGFAACMTDRGVTIDEIPLDSEGRPRLELVLDDVDFANPDAIAALGDCSELLAEGALDLSIWPQLQEEVQQVLEGFSECVRSHGVVNFPDPVRLFGGVGGPYALDEIPFDDTDLESAVEICSSRITEGSR